MGILEDSKQAFLSAINKKGLAGEYKRLMQEITADLYRDTKLSQEKLDLKINI